MRKYSESKAKHEVKSAGCQLSRAKTFVKSKQVIRKQAAKKVRRLEKEIGRYEKSTIGSFECSRLEGRTMRYGFACKPLLTGTVVTCKGQVSTARDTERIKGAEKCTNAEEVDMKQLGEKKQLRNGQLGERAGLWRRRRRGIGFGFLAGGIAASKARKKYKAKLLRTDKIFLKLTRNSELESKQICKGKEEEALMGEVEVGETVLGHSKMSTNDSEDNNAHGSERSQTRSAPAVAAPGIGCLAKDGETADCSKDPAVVKEAIKLIEKSPHPNAAVRAIQRSKQSGNHATIRRTSRGSPLQTDQTTKLQRKVKDLERQLKRCRMRPMKSKSKRKGYPRKSKRKRKGNAIAPPLHTNSAGNGKAEKAARYQRVNAAFIKQVQCTPCKHNCINKDNTKKKAECQVAKYCRVPEGRLTAIQAAQNELECLQM